jgi:site-specific recombinase XerD
MRQALLAIDSVIELCLIDRPREHVMLTHAQTRWPLKRALKNARLKHIGWHALRHSFASHLVMRGAPVKCVQELLGHCSIERTMRHAHLSPDVRRDAVKLLDVREPVRLTWTTSRGVVLQLRCHNTWAGMTGSTARALAKGTH